MSTLEYELGKHPGPPERERIEVDPITLRVLGGAFHAIAKEMAGVLFRMSYSSIIRESEDLGAGIFDAQGRELCESDSTPMHIGSLPWYIRGFMRHLEGKVQEGDVIIHNHPYYGASHSPDIAVAVPIFHDDELLGFAAVTAHVLDVGGSFPGINADAFDMYAEAKIYDGLRWYQAGRLNEDLDRMVFDNVRTETMNRGDMNAMMAACQLGHDRFLRLVQRYGVETVMSAAYDWMDYSENMLREQIAKIPDGEYKAPTGLARRRRSQPRRPPTRRDEGDRRGRRDHHRPHRLERGGADGLQRPLRGLAARRRVLRGTHDPARRGDVPRARAAERRHLPAGQGDRAEGHDLQPDLPAGLLLAFLPGAAGRRQHDPRAGRRIAGAGDGGKLRRHPLLRVLGVLGGDGRVLALPRGERGLRTAGATARTRWTPSTT